MCGRSDWMSDNDGLTCNGKCPVEPKPAPVVAAEGRYALHFANAKGIGFFAVLNRSGGETGARDEVLAVKGDRLRGDGAVVRILPDGAHEAAVEAARREERERVAALLATEAERMDIGCEESGVYLRAAEIAKKGQAK